MAKVPEYRAGRVSRGGKLAECWGEPGRGVSGGGDKPGPLIRPGNRTMELKP
jgi:hypothetical protein